MSREPDAGDAGMSLVEILVAMLILATIALLTLPLFSTSLRQAAGNSTAVTASELVDGTIAKARTQAASGCAALSTFAATTPAVVTDGMGRPLAQTMTAIACPAANAYPATLQLTVTVSSGGSVLATASTRILVSAA